MKSCKLFSFIVAVLALIACADRKTQPRETMFFASEVRLKTTPVKNQGSSSLCWAYAMLATIETERLMLGDSIHLSPDFVFRKLMELNAGRYYFTHDKRDLSARGMSSMLINLISTHGIVPYDSYESGKGIDDKVLSRKMGQAAKSASSLRKLNQSVKEILDKAIGFLPNTIYVSSFPYTPVEFAHSVCRPSEYINLTSFEHHPFNKKFALEVPDNRMNDQFLNLPVDTLMGHIENALLRGHPVCWEGDITEPGFSFDTGVAKLEDETKVVTQEARQIAFEQYKTTDDHCMELVGLARDKEGNRYFIAKNSWGTNNPYHGFMYLSNNYVRLKTIAVYMTNEAFANH